MAKQLKSILLMKQFFTTLSLSLVLMLASHHTASAQQDVTFWGKEDAYLMRQAAMMFDLADKALSENPPTVGAPTVRKLALYNLDAMLHETKYDNSEPFKNFVRSRTGKVIEDMKQPVKKGAKIYKIYNDGFVARTKSVTIAFDVVRGTLKGEKIISDELISAIVDQCDILFLTHNHGDHVDRFVADRFIKAGKPVIAASEILKGVDGVTHYRSESEVLHHSADLLTGEKLSLRIYPGHQSEMMCNVYAVTTPEGLTFAHTGDQYRKEDFEWIEKVKEDEPQIDALMINCWSMNIADAIKGFNPRYVLTGHENEMGHTIDHREAFWLTFQKMEPVEHDYVVMGWGEWFSFK